MKHSIQEALDSCFSTVFTSSRRLGPGQVVLRQREDVREKLRELKSSDLANIRDDEVRKWIG